MKRIYTVVLLTLALGACDLLRAADDVTAQEEAAFKAAAAAVAPSVVRIETFGGSEKVGGVLIGSGPTTGLVVDAQGYILSSAFNFVQKPSSILVTLPNGKRAAAQIVSRDQSRMLVLLKVDTDEKLPVPNTIARSALEVGQWAIAVGRTFDPAVPNVSVGVVSATNRVWGKAIQADAKISPSNYGGPLVDLQGRVMGILVPMSPQGQGEVAGAEWYDSGIGFAVPLDEMLTRLDTMKSGQDLLPGLIGISLKNGDINADPAVIMACQPKGPADKAGLKAQDKIVQIDGLPIERQAQLKHALGPKYAGDTVTVVVMRGDQRVEAQVPLVEKLEPYRHPMIGILPMRDKAAEPGVRVRYVFPESPAAQAGLAVGDRIVKFGDLDVGDAAALSDRLAATEPGAQLTIHFVRNAEAKSADVTLASLSAIEPGELPPASANKDAEQPQPPTGLVEVKIPEEKNECWAYVPPGYHAGEAHALLVVLHAPGKYDRDELLARYQATCEAHNIVLVMPKSANATRWDNTDAAFIKKAVEDVAGHYTVDKNRVAISGFQTAGVMAWLTALSHADTFRCVIAVEAPLPQRTSLPTGEPSQRVWYCLGHSAKSPQALALAATAKRIEEASHPLWKLDTGATARDLNAEELDRIGRWLDSLDRL